MDRANQPGLFGRERPLPEGLKYRPEFLSSEEEADLVRRVAALPFRHFEFHGFTGNRRVVSFGWRYDFGDARLREAEEMPPFLLPLRERAAALAGLPPSDFQHAMVTEYAPGATIGWHDSDARAVGKLAVARFDEYCVHRPVCGSMSEMKNPAASWPIVASRTGQPAAVLPAKSWTRFTLLTGMPSSRGTSRPVTAVLLMS
jgi:hypothetical protein